MNESLRFYTGLLGMKRLDNLKDGDLVFLKTPGCRDLLALNPGGSGGIPGGCEREMFREKHLAGVQGGGRVVLRCDEETGPHIHTYLADPDGYVVEIQYGR